jgi:hypothetical protein
MEEKQPFIEMAHKLYELLLSSNGQDMVRESGYIPYY